MKLAMRLPEKGKTGAANDADPRDTAPAEVIDLASRTAYPAVANGRGGRSDALGLAAGVGFVTLLGAATLWGLNASRMSEAEQAVAGVPATLTPEEQATFLPPPPLEDLPSANAVPGMGVPPAPSPIYSADPNAQAGPATNPYASPTLVYDGAPVGQELAVPAPIEAGGAPAGEAPGAGSAGDFAARVGGVGGGPAEARSDINPATTVAQGTMIPAVLETAINTDVPGYVRAVVSQDVRSFDGSRVLVPRSSRLVGQYQSGLQAGQRRAYVIWQRLIRPDGVSVALASPATSFDGTTGLEGRVDSHFFSRFGSAMLLSVIGGLSNLATSGASVVLGGGGGQTAASTALQQDGQRSPTVRVSMGTPVRVYTARDLDFASAPRVR
jgi:type IV secretion system protein VirB10